MNPETIARLDGKPLLIVQPNLPRPVHGMLKADHERQTLEIVAISPVQAVYTHPLESALEIEEILASEKTGQIRFSPSREFLPETYFG